jgi:hypothetical protein
MGKSETKEEKKGFESGLRIEVYALKVLIEEQTEEYGVGPESEPSAIGEDAV